MELMQLRRSLLFPQIKTIGGLPVLFDNAYYRSGNAKIDSYLTDDRFFLTVAFDTGSTSSKSYTMYQFNRNSNNISFDAYSRWFDDLQSTSKDYWGVTTVSSSTSRTLSSYGRLIVASVLKSEAANFYIYDNTNQRYVCKGKNVNYYHDGDKTFVTTSLNQLSIPIPPGNYELSCVVTSTDVDKTQCLFRLLDESEQDVTTPATILLDRSINGVPTKYRFTITEPATKMYLYASTTYNRSVEDTASFTDIWITKV